MDQQCWHYLGAHWKCSFIFSSCLCLLNKNLHFNKTLVDSIEETVMSHCSMISLCSEFLSALFLAVHSPEYPLFVVSSNHGLKLFNFQVLSGWQNTLFNLWPMKMISSSVSLTSPTVSSVLFIPGPGPSSSALTTV